MEKYRDLWSIFNERIKFFFDALRNLGISVGVLVASKYMEGNQKYSVDYKDFHYLGYVLIMVCTIHFVVGTFFYFPTSKSFGMKRRSFPIQFILFVFYFLILLGIFTFRSEHI